MNLRLLLVLLLFGAMTSVGYAIGVSGGADLAPLDDMTSNNVPFVKSGTGNIPGGNAFDGMSLSGDNNLNNLANGAQPLVIAVPEPSTTALVGLGFLGLATMGIRRRARFKKS